MEKRLQNRIAATLRASGVSSPHSPPKPPSLKPSIPPLIVPVAEHQPSPSPNPPRQRQQPQINPQIKIEDPWITRVSENLSQELCLLGIDENGPPSEKRLQVLSEVVLNAMIDLFPGWSTLVAHVKAECDGVLAKMKNELNDAHRQIELHRMGAEFDCAEALEEEEQRCSELQAELDKARSDLYALQKKTIQPLQKEPSALGDGALFRMRHFLTHSGDVEASALKEQLEKANQTIHQLRSDMRSRYVPNTEKMWLLDRLKDTQSDLEDALDRESKVSEQLQRLRRVIRDASAAQGSRWSLSIAEELESPRSPRKPKQTPRGTNTNAFTPRLQPAAVVPPLRIARNRSGSSGERGRRKSISSHEDEEPVVRRRRSITGPPLQRRASVSDAFS